LWYNILAFLLVFLAIKLYQKAQKGLLQIQKKYLQQPPILCVEQKLITKAKQNKSDRKITQKLY